MTGEIITDLILGIVIGFCIGLTGVGGGVLVMPALTLILHMQASVAVGTASLYAFLTKMVASYHHFRLQTISTRVAGPLLVGAIPTNIVVALAVNSYLHTHAGTQNVLHFQTALRIGIAVVVLLAALSILARLCATHGKVQQATLLAQYLEARPLGFRIAAVSSGALVGGLIGATSVGGGVVLVPLLIMVFGLSSKDTVGTSIAVAVVLTLCTSLVYGRGAQMEWLTAVLMAAGSIVGVPIGSKLSVRLPERPLQWVLTGVILVCAILMIFKQGH